MFEEPLANVHLPEHRDVRHHTQLARMFDRQLRPVHAIALVDMDPRPPAFGNLALPLVQELFRNLFLVAAGGLARRVSSEEVQSPAKINRASSGTRASFSSLRNSGFRIRDRAIIFFDSHSVVILTRGFEKKSMKIPRQEIERAETYRRDYVNRKGKKR